MTATLAFDVYGTLIDTHGVIRELKSMVGDTAAEFSRVWREKQLEYTFRRGLMRRYCDFSVCTQEALDFTCAVMQIDLSRAERKKLIEAYRMLPVFEDVISALDRLSTADYRLYAFSNGNETAVRPLLEQAGILHYFIDVVSVHEVKSFKPDPDVYHHLLLRCQSEANSTWLISSNAFDVLGAKSAGLRSAWLKRSVNSVFDPWQDLAADIEVKALTLLDEAISQL